MNLLTTTEFNKSGPLYVVMDKFRTTVLQTPGSNKPFFTKKRKYAEYVAREAGGVVETFRDAIGLVASSPCNLPHDSKLYSADKTAPKLRLGRNG